MGFILIPMLLTLFVASWAALAVMRRTVRWAWADERWPSPPFERWTPLRGRWLRAAIMAPLAFAAACIAFYLTAVVCVYSCFLGAYLALFFVVRPSKR